MFTYDIFFFISTRLKEQLKTSYLPPDLTKSKLLPLHIEIYFTRVVLLLLHSFLHDKKRRSKLQVITYFTPTCCTRVLFYIISGGHDTTLSFILY